MKIMGKNSLGYLLSTLSSQLSLSKRYTNQCIRVRYRTVKILREQSYESEDIASVMEQKEILDFCFFQVDIIQIFSILKKNIQ